MTTLHYFMSGNTSQGYVNLLPASLQALSYLCVIDGPFQSDIARVLSQLDEQISPLVEEVHYLHNPSDPEQLEGIIYPQLNVGLVSVTPRQNIAEQSLNRATLTLNMYDFYNLDQLEPIQKKIDELTTLIEQNHQQAYKGYAEALLIHDEWEAIYIRNMDFDIANNYANKLLGKLIPKQNNRANVRAIHRFLGAATPIGAVDYVPNLTNGLTRYFIKGRPGSGKSTLLKKIVEAGLSNGYELEIYQCGLDPQSLDMVIIRELEFAIFDSTAPHEYAPSEANDHLIDMYKLCIKPNTDEQFAPQLASISDRYRQAMKSATKHLTEAKRYQDERAELTWAALKHDSLTQIEQTIAQNVKAVIEQTKK